MKLVLQCTDVCVVAVLLIAVVGVLPKTVCEDDDTNIGQLYNTPFLNTLSIIYGHLLLSIWHLHPLPPPPGQVLKW